MRFFKRIIIVIAILFGLILLSVGGAAYYVYSHQEEIMQQALTQINKKLKAPVSIQKIDVSFFENFPLVSLRLENVTAEELPAPANYVDDNATTADDSTTVNNATMALHQPETLLKAHAVLLSFNIIDIFYKNYTIKEIAIEDGEFNLKQYNAINNNYIIWKTQKDTASTLSFKLSKIIAHNTFVRFRNYAKQIDIKILCKDMLGNGELYSGGQFFKVRGGYFAQFFSLDNQVWLKEREGNIDIEFSHDNKNEKVSITKGGISANDMNFLVSGDVQYGLSTHSLNLNITGNKLKLEQLLSILPEHLRKNFEEIESKGALTFEFTVKGDYSKNLAVEANFDYNNGTVIDKKSKYKLSNIFLKGSYTNGAERNFRTSKLSVEKLELTPEQGQVSGRLEVENFLDPDILFDGMLQAELAQIAPFVGLRKDKWRVEGKAEMQLYYKGKISAVSADVADITEALQQADCKGNLSVEKLLVQKQDEFTLKSESLSAVFSPQQISILQTDFAFRNRTINADLKASASITDFLSKHPKIQANIVTANMQWEKVELNNISTTAHYTNKFLKLNSLKTEVLGGSYKGDVAINFSHIPTEINVTGSATNIDINKTFLAFDNFNQQTLTDKNIYGNISSDFAFQAKYDTAFQSESVVLEATMQIKNGNLKNVKALKEISRFTGENNLQDIKFSEISNAIHIKERTITIPAMYIASDAAEFNIRGTHTFENYADYYLNLELSDLLSKNFKQRKNKDEEFGNLVEDEKARVRLPLHVFGHIDNLKVKYDFKQSKKNFKEKTQVERQKDKEILQKEFARTTEKIQENKQQQEQWKEQEKGKFIFEKDEDETPKKPQTQPTTKPKSKNNFTIEEDE